MATLSFFSPAPVTYVLVCVCLLVVPLLVSAACGPAPISGYNYDFSSIGNVVASSTDGRIYNLNTCGNPLGGAVCWGWPSVLACCTWSPGYVVNMGTSWTWSYIDNNNPWMGAKATITGGTDRDDTDKCPAPNQQVITTVLFTCTDTVNFQGTDTFKVTYYPPSNGTGPCLWTITGNMKQVCPYFATNWKASSSSSSTGGVRSSSSSSSPLPPPATSCGPPALSDGTALNFTSVGEQLVQATDGREVSTHPKTASTDTLELEAMNSALWLCLYMLCV